VADESKSSEETHEEDPTSEAQRFFALLSLLDKNVPELEAWRLEDGYGDEFDSEVLGLSEAWMLATRHLFDDGDRPIDVDGVWPRLLAVIEVALVLCEQLFDDARDDDGLAVDVFAGSGIMCDVTRNVASLEVLLPWMGPVSLESARIEISNHTTSRSYDINDVDRSKSGLSYKPLAISPLALVPDRRS
jgi:hypothetical protein